MESLGFTSLLTLGDLGDPFENPPSLAEETDFAETERKRRDVTRFLNDIPDDSLTPAPKYAKYLNDEQRHLEKFPGGENQIQQNVSANVVDHVDDISNWKEIDHSEEFEEFGNEEGNEPSAEDGVQNAPAYNFHQQDTPVYNIHQQDAPAYNVQQHNNNRMLSNRQFLVMIILKAQFANFVVTNLQFDVNVEQAEIENHFLHDNEQIIKATIKATCQQSTVFQMCLYLYGPEVKHEGNKQTCYCEIISESDNCRQEDVSNAMNAVFDCLIFMGQKRVYFTCPWDDTAKTILNNANLEWKLALDNCDDSSIKVNKDKWNDIREGNQLIYYARQYLGGKHWTFGKLDMFPLYLPLMGTLETKFQEMFGNGVTIQSVFYADKKTKASMQNLWQKFTRYARDKVWPGIEGPGNIYVACLKVQLMM